MPVPVGDLLPHVERPSRYLGLEVNSIHAGVDDPASALRAALVFPDLYEVGMAHLGTRILYGLGNLVDRVQVERVFLPAPDMLNLLEEKNLPLFTLESRTPVGECGLVGVTLQSELTYTNILTILNASKIPLVARERTGNHPVVLGGGPCGFNPEPLSEFFDLFFLGEGEKAWPEILETLAFLEEKGVDREGKIQELKRMDGIYDPADFEPRYDEAGRLKGIDRVREGRTLARAVPLKLEGGYTRGCFIVPFSQPVHDRLNIEVTRGCTRGCRFCNAGMVYRPARERSAQSVLEIAREALESTGQDDLALTSLSIGDFSCLDEVLETLMDRYEMDRVSISLPSMRIGGLTPSVARQILRVRRTGFTIAPEAGTERLRRVINKDFTDEEILQTARWVFGHGWDGLKLYFMIGLPSETDEDLKGIAFLAGRIAREAPPRSKVTVNLSPFVPKPHTPFQWAAQVPEPEMKRRLDLVRENLRGPGLQVRWGRTDQALLEAVLARGGRRLSRTIRAAWEKGAVMEGWSEHFRMDLWREAFRETGVTPEEEAERERDEDEVFPWDHIPSGVSRDFLLREYRKSLAGETTPDCREERCHSCGACPPEGKNAAPPLRKTEAVPERTQEEGRNRVPEPDPVARRLRFVFQKTGDLRFLGHLELVKVLERALKRAGVPLSFSGGFSPKPKLTLALSLPAGAEGAGELMDLELSETLSPKEVIARISGHLPPGIDLLRGWKVPLEGDALNSRVASITYRAVLPSPRPGMAETVREFFARESLPVRRVRKGKEKVVDLKEFLLSLSARDDQTLDFTLALVGEEGTARPSEVLRFLLDLDDEGLADVRLVRTSMALRMDSGGALFRAALARVWD